MKWDARITKWAMSRPPSKSQGEVVGGGGWAEADAKGVGVACPSKVEGLWMVVLSWCSGAAWPQATLALRRVGGCQGPTVVRARCDRRLKWRRPCGA